MTEMISQCSPNGSSVRFCWSPPEQSVSKVCQPHKLMGLHMYSYVKTKDNLKTGVRKCRKKELGV
jgi:hypothetical protein